MEKAINIVEKADIFVVIGTSLVVYPAAALINYVHPGVPIYYIDPNPADTSAFHGVTVIPRKATAGMQTLANMLIKD